MLCTEIVFDIQKNFFTQHLLPMFCKKKSLWQRFTCRENYRCKQQKYSNSPWTRLIHWHFLEFRFKGNWIKAKIPVKFKSSDGHTVGWVSKTEDADLIIQVITCWWFAHHYYCAIVLPQEKIRQIAVKYNGIWCNNTYFLGKGQVRISD